MSKYKYFIPSIIVMIIIFIFSHQDGNTSSDTSFGIILFLENYFSITIDSYIIRKIAHMSEYALLYLTFYYGYIHTKYKPYSMSMLSSVLYACSDEFHQVFVDGRCGSIIDVGIDSIGMLVMMGVIYIVMAKRKA